MSGFIQLTGLLAWVVLLAVVFALLEIQIEGSAGWAENLPTWRRPMPRWLRFLWGGRPCTGYHVYLFLFMAMVFHLPLFVETACPQRAEAQILGGLMLFWILEDFFWFVFNPAWGVRSFRPGRVPWHRYWVLGVPVDYVIYTVVAVALFILSLRMVPLSEGPS